MRATILLLALVALGAVSGCKKSAPLTAPPVATTQTETPEQAIAAIENCGGSVTPMDTGSNGSALRAHFHRSANLSTGLDHLKNLPQLKSLSLVGSDATDAQISHIEGLTQLEDLSLEFTKVTDAGMAPLEELSQLRHLSLLDTRITDAGLQYLKSLSKIEHMNLSGTRLTDAGLESLKGMNLLTTLDLSFTKVTDAGLEQLRNEHKNLFFIALVGTQVTDQGVAKFQESLPKCHIMR